MPLHVSSTSAHHQEVKIALHSLWYHHTYRCDDSWLNTEINILNISHQIRVKSSNECYLEEQKLDERPYNFHLEWVMQWKCGIAYKPL